jgi:hypothetical protein
MLIDRAALGGFFMAKRRRERAMQNLIRRPIGAGLDNDPDDTGTSIATSGVSKTRLSIAPELENANSMP